MSDPALEIIERRPRCACVRPDRKDQNVRALRERRRQPRKVVK